MNRAFVSYSLADKDRYVVSMLTSELQRNGLLVLASNNFFSPTPDFTTKKNIDSADLFIGVITDQSNAHQRVFNEWNYANERKIPNIFVIEDSVQTDSNYRGNLIRFNRHNVEAAISYINQRIQLSKGANQNKQEWIPWVLGGAAVLTLLSLLQKE